MPKYEGGRGEFHLREYPRSESKAKDVKEREKKERKSVITMVSTCRLNQQNL